MENSFCGKNCEDCLDKADVGCPGCKLGPGKASGALCEIAKCCIYREKDECATCENSTSCFLLSTREMMLQKWNGRGRENAATPVTATATSASAVASGTVSASNTENRTNRSRDGHDAAFVRKSLIALFWLFLGSGFANVLSNENVFGMFPGVIMLIGSLLSFGASIAQAILMIRLGREESTYKVAGICNLVATGALFGAEILIAVSLAMLKLSDMFAVGVAAIILAILLLVAALVLTIIAGYKFLVANARVVEWRDPNLSDRWIVMSKLYFGIFLGILVLVLFTFLLPLLGVILMFAYLLGVLAFGICEYVFVYQTANRFRE